ncbi:MAG TPA: hypothetical protein VNF07_01805 [Acidimicrobiales bacterium]|nr:hypothetical protein [Acidimicrobiales bacterium]
MKESERFELGQKGATHYQRALAEASQHEVTMQGLSSYVLAEDQQWEQSPQGLLKHLVNDQMGTREFALDMYLQVIEAGEHSGKHRHFSEEVIYILEGSGYDLHWDPEFTVDVSYTWTWAEEPQRFEWAAEDFVVIPPYVNHQHFAGPDGRVRFVSSTARIIKAMGFDGLEQVESVEAHPHPGQPTGL